MATLYSDNFNRADSASMGGSWAVPAFAASTRILGNAASASADSVDSFAYWNDTTPNDQWARVVLTAEWTAGPVVRLTPGASANCYFVDTAEGNLNLNMFDDGGWSNIDQVAYSYTSGDEIELRAVGTTISVLLNDVEVISVTDSTHASGRFGIFAYAGGARLDSFEGGDFNSGATITGTGALSAQTPTVAGVAERTVRRVSGTPTAQSATIAGTGTVVAPRRVIRPATILAAQSATVAGTGTVT